MVKLIASFSYNVQISQLQDDKEPYTDDEDLIETYDNQRLVIISIYFYRIKQIIYVDYIINVNIY